MRGFRLSFEQFAKAILLTHLAETSIKIADAVICQGEKQKDVALRFNVTQQRVSEIVGIVRAAYLHSENAPDNWQHMTMVLPAKLEKVVKRFVAFLMKSLDTKQPVSEISFEGFSIVIKKEVAADPVKKAQVETLSHLDRRRNDQKAEIYEKYGVDRRAHNHEREIGTDGQPESK